MAGYLTLILFNFFDSIEQHFTYVQNDKIFTILQNYFADCLLNIICFHVFYLV